MGFLDSNLHVNQALTDYAVAFRQEEAGYLWSKLLPPKVVAHRSDIIRQIDKGQLLRLYDLRVGRGGRAGEIQYKIGSNLTFNCIDYAVEAIVRATEAANADAILQHEQELIYHATIAMHTNIEYVTVKSILRDTTVMTNNTTLAAADRWDSFNSPSSDPVEDIKRKVLRIKSRTGHAPNVVMMHDMVWDVIQRHPKTLERGAVHNGGLGIVDKAMFERICDLPPGSLMTTSQTYNLAQEDQTADFRSFIGDDVIIAYVEPAGVRSYGLGQMFMWPGDELGNMTKQAGMAAPFSVLQFPDNWKDIRGANVLRIVGSLDPKVLNVDAGELLVDVVDSSDSTAYGSFLNN